MQWTFQDHALLQVLLGCIMLLALNDSIPILNEDASGWAGFEARLYNGSSLEQNGYIYYRCSG